MIKWKNIFNIEKKKKYFKNIINFINISKKNNKIIYPDNKDIFNAFKYTEFDKLKIVIIGQDPYVGKNQANGLCFSVNENIKLPNSLINIYKELIEDVKIKMPKHGNLKKWAKQGILLLNTILTVEKNKPLSHSNIGWETFTKKIIKIINYYNKNIIFLLWGNYSKKNIEKLINKKKHFILQTSHPSSLSFYKGFYGSKHFSKSNEILKKINKKIIDWQI